MRFFSPFLARLLAGSLLAKDLALRFLLPWACAGCRTPLETVDDAGFCPTCWLSLPRIQGWVCRFCGIPLKDGGNLCFHCRGNPTKILIRAAVTYTPPIPRAIQRFKYAGRRTLHRPFGSLMLYAWNHYPELQPVDLVTPVPLHPSTYHDRGYNQAAVLAETIASAIDRPVLTGGLFRARKTPAQFRLTRAERLTNLLGAFSLAPEALPALKTRHVLLIDDVCTTGATLHECAGVLRQAGAKSVKALALARD